jgi:peptidoglycan/xylan/chitin deacetylase (PgdA/CDA1 family)
MAEPGRQRRRVPRALPVACSLALFAAGTASASEPPGCGPEALGTARTLTLPREAAAYGRAQHAALPLLPGEVVLTFDDGPRPESTPQVLQALARQCVRATFFVNGEPLLRWPSLARDLVAQGHSVGMHGFGHHAFGELAPSLQLADLKAMQGAFREVLGSEPATYRFPYLAETTTLRDALAAAGVTVMSVDAGADDWLPDQSPQQLADRLLERLRATGGGIVLLHDAQDQTAAALPLMLQRLKEQAYRVVHLRWD